MEINSIAGALQDIGEEMLDDWLELEDEFDGADQEAAGVVQQNHFAI